MYVFGNVNSCLLFCVIKEFLFTVWAIHLTWCSPQLVVKQNFGLNMDLSCAPLLCNFNKCQKTEKTISFSSKQTGF